MAIAAATDGISKFWSDGQNPLENAVRMMYKSSWLEGVIFSRNLPQTLIWPWQVPLMEFLNSDWIFRAPLRIRSWWCIGHPDWWRSHFPEICLKHNAVIEGATDEILNFFQLKFRIPLKIKFWWCIDHHDWWRSYFPKIWLVLKH